MAPAIIPRTNPVTAPSNETYKVTPNHELAG